HAFCPQVLVQLIRHIPEMTFPVIIIYIASRRYSITIRLAQAAYIQVLISVTVIVIVHRYRYVHIITRECTHIKAEVPLPVIDIQPVLALAASLLHIIASSPDEQVLVSISIGVKEQNSCLFKILVLIKLLLLAFDKLPFPCLNIQLPALTLTRSYVHIFQSIPVHVTYCYLRTLS